MVATLGPHWFIDPVDADAPDAARWIWRCMDARGKLLAESPVRFKTFLDAYADAKRNGMDAHEFVPRTSQRAAS
jgi:hypothetical protein